MKRRPTRPTYTTAARPPTSVFTLVAVAAGILSALVHPGTATAQGPGSEMIPREVAEAFLTDGLFMHRGGGVEILVGRMPGDLAELLPPEPDGTVVGSLVRPVVTEVILDLSGEPRQVLTRWEDALLGDGWDRLDASRAPQDGGFASSSPGRAYQFCRGDSLSLTLDVDRHGEGSRLRAWIPRGEASFNVCRDREAVTRSRTADASPLPVLTPPPGVIFMAAAGASGGDRYDSRATAETDMPVGELADHYHWQLRDSGWLPLGEAAGEHVVIYRYRVPDEEGDRPWLGLLTVSEGAEPEQRYLTLEARRFRRW